MRIDLDSLPDDAALLKGMLRDAAVALHERDAQLQERDVRIEELERQNPGDCSWMTLFAVRA